MEEPETGMKKIKKINSYRILMLLILFSIFQYGIRKICGFTMYPDEFGYWASAAELAGYDWSEVASMGSYYSFGYSVVLFPILMLFKNGVTAYRVAVFVNILFMCAGIFLFQKILSLLFPDMGKNEKNFVGGIAVFYPVWIFYAQMTMVEGLLFFLFVLTVYLLLKFLERPTIGKIVAFAFALVYMYCVHMRTVGVLAAGIITLFGWATAGKGKKRHLHFFTAALLLIGIMALALKNKVVWQVFSFADKDVLSGNDYGSQWIKIKYIFAGGGFWSFVNGIAGKVFYLGITSLGAFYWAIYWCVKEIILAVKEIGKERKGNCKIGIRPWTAFFLLLAAAGEIVISSIYMNGAGSIDCLVYGRYNEFLVPVMLAVGVAAMLKSRFLFRKILLFGAAMGCIMGYLLNIVEKYGLSGFRGYHAAGMSYLLKEELLKEGSFDMTLFFCGTYALAVGGMLLASVLIWAARKKESMAWILSGILLLEIGAGMQMSAHYTYSVNNTNFENFMIADILLEESKEEDTVAYLDEGKPAFIDLIQMQLKGKSIHVIKKEMFWEILEKQKELPDFLITYIDTEQEEAVKELYEKKADANTFCLYIKKNRERGGSEISEN